MNTEKSLLLFAAALAFASCTATKTNTYPGAINFVDNDPPITQSLFEDKSATISEENIQKILDVRTGLIPFTTIITKDFQDKKNDADINESEARNRIKNQAVLSTIEEIGIQLEAFLEK